MSSERHLPLKQLFLIFFVVVLLAEADQALSFKAGKDNITTTPPGLFACKKITFDVPFYGGKQVKVLASVGHAVRSPTHRYGAAIWVESVSTSGFTVCVLEFGDGSNGTASVNWVALQSTPARSQLGTATLKTWTTGTKCHKIDFQKSFKNPPRLFVTATHQTLMRPQDAMAVWVEELNKNSFKVCLRETKILDGRHENIKINWMAFTNLTLDNFTLTDSLVFSNTSLLSNQNNHAFCQTINFRDEFYAPPVVLVTPKHSHINNYSHLSQCNAVTAWVEHTSAKDTKVCVRNYNHNTNNKDIITVDYMVIGDRDPCLDVTCHYHGLCKAFGPHDARCVCVDSCPSYHEPVCSSNGTTYDNECLYKQEMCLLQLNFTVQHPGSCEGFPFQRGRRHMPHIPSLGYSHCEVIRFKPYVFYSDKTIEVQITVNHIDTSNKSYVHDAAVSWVENVSYDQFTACVMAAGYNERKSRANVTVDWMAYQGAPVGGVAGDVRISQWWTGTTCESVNFPPGKFLVKPSVFVTAKHHHFGLKRDAASVWIEDVTPSSCKFCLRELQNYAGSHQDISVNWLAFTYLRKPPFSEHNSIYFVNSKPPPGDHNNAFCKDVTFANAYNTTPNVFISANHSTKGGNLSPVHNGITAWVEYINKTGFRVCFKEFYEAKYDPLSISYTVMSDVDECTTNSHGCDFNAICNNTMGSYNCTCKPGFKGDGKKCTVLDPGTFTTRGSGRFGTIQTFTVPRNALYLIKAWGARGGTHSYNYGYNPGTYYGGKGAYIEGKFRLTKGTVLNIVVGQRGGNSVEVKDGQKTTKTAAQLGLSVEDNAGTGGGGGSFVYTTSNVLLLVAGGGGGASSGYNGVDGQSGTSGTSSVGKVSFQVRAGGTGGQPGQCNRVGASYHGGVGAGWYAQGCARKHTQNGESGGSLAQGWIGGQAGGMNSGNNGGPVPGAVGGFGGGGGGSEDNGASGGGGGYSGGGSGTNPHQAGGGGGSYCSGQGCSGVTGGNSNDVGLVKIIELSA
ncbi:hypothetical protein ACROYT_G031050 [Oculina patagonica]